MVHSNIDPFGKKVLRSEAYRNINKKLMNWRREGVDVESLLEDTEIHERWHVQDGRARLSIHIVMKKDNDKKD